MAGCAVNGDEEVSAHQFGPNLLLDLSIRLFQFLPDKLLTNFNLSRLVLLDVAGQSLYMALSVGEEQF